ncbi:unnamed protein product [Sphagnum jensenii]|uniref:PLATZ transcription factor family protein n=1 Tax=Sphagnum jensenii TaxID=128206 RepID=A0ABP1BGH5_9BRYO
MRCLLILNSIDWGASSYVRIQFCDENSMPILSLLAAQGLEDRFVVFEIITHHIIPQILAQKEELAIKSVQLQASSSPAKARRIKAMGGPIRIREGDGDNPTVEPRWLKPLLATSFFSSCQIHGMYSHKCECNLFCLECTERGGICSLCLPQHKDHHVVQIRRSSYHDVIRVSEIQKVLDITGVQTYIINSARVVFLNERPQPRPAKGVTNTCQSCERSLLDTFRFCSLGCKLQGIKRHGDMSFVVQPRVTSQGGGLSALGLSSDESEEDSSSPISQHLLTDIMSPRTPPPSTSLRAGCKRRKGIPHRAPLGSILVTFMSGGLDPSPPLPIQTQK